MKNTKLVSAIVVDGKTLLKKEGRSELPFGCEYSIYMKNLENRKVSISVSIDGKDILNGNKIILNSGEDITLERFLEKLDEGRKLRFIQKTKEIENFRGNRAEDGIVVINYTFERENDFRIRHPFEGRIHTMGLGGLYSQEVFACTNSVDNSSVSSKPASLRSNATFSNQADRASLSTEKGITVEGTESKQSFRQGYIGELEYTTHVDTIELFGYKSENGIEVACETVFVKEKFCPSCGKRYTAGESIDYCINDGTYLKETLNGVDIKQQIC